MLERNPLLVSLDLSACRSEAPWRSSWTAAISEDAEGADGEDAREACVHVGDGSFLKKSEVSRSGDEEGGGGVDACGADVHGVGGNEGSDVLDAQAVEVRLHVCLSCPSLL